MCGFRSQGFIPGSASSARKGMIRCRVRGPTPGTSSKAAINSSSFEQSAKQPSRRAKSSEWAVRGPTPGRSVHSDCDAVFTCRPNGLMSPDEAEPWPGQADAASPDIPNTTRNSETRSRRPMPCSVFRSVIGHLVRDRRGSLAKRPPQSPPHGQQLFMSRARLALMIDQPETCGIRFILMA